MEVEAHRDSEGRNEAEQRAYHQGRVDAKLEEHDAHFVTINGSIVTSGKRLAELGVLVEKLVDRVEKLVLVGSDPVQALLQDRRTGEAVANAIAEKTEAERTRWEQVRGKVQWGGGALVTLILIANFVHLHFHFH